MSDNQSQNDAENSAPPTQNPPHMFQPGRSGNPGGKPKGADRIARRAIHKILQEGSVDIAKQIVAAAQSGDMRAAEIVLRRIMPERKGAVVEFEMPKLETADDAVEAMARISLGVTTGELTTAEAADLAGVVETWRKTIETADIERRLKALEAFRTIN